MLDRLAQYYVVPTTSYEEVIADQRDASSLIRYLQEGLDAERQRRARVRQVVGLLRQDPRPEPDEV